MKKNCRYFLYILCFTFLLIGVTDCNSCKVFGSKLLQYDWFNYKVDDNGITIISARTDIPEDYYYNNYPKVLTIPNKINGIKVVSAKPHLFKEGEYEYSDHPTGFTTIKCSDYMETVNLESFAEALYGFDSIETTIILGKYTRHFNQHNTTAPWGNSYYFDTIKVPKNAAYLKAAKNGAVYTKDGKVLVAYPSKHRRKSLKISSNTIEIEDYAFDQAVIDTITFPKSVKKISVHAFEGFGPGYYGNTPTYHDGIVRVPKSKLKYYKKVFRNTKYFRGEIVTY